MSKSNASQSAVLKQTNSKPSKMQQAESNNADQSQIWANYEYMKHSDILL